MNRSSRPDRSALRVASIPKARMMADMQDRQDHFAYSVQLFGGTTAFSRRLRIDERAIRRFISGEKPISDGLLQDTAKALRDLAAEASGAAEHIAQLPASDFTTS